MRATKPLAPSCWPLSPLRAYSAVPAARPRRAAARASRSARRARRLLNYTENRSTWDSTFKKFTLPKVLPLQAARNGAPWGWRRVESAHVKGAQHGRGGFGESRLCCAGTVPRLLPRLGVRGEVT